MKAAVTGATGLIGSHITKLLVDEGHDVRVLIRKSSDLRNIEGLAVDMFTGDIQDQQSLNGFLKDCDFLFHAAADYTVSGRKEEVIKKNLAGTTNILDLALEYPLKKIIYTSSIAAIGSGSLENPATEETGFDFYGMGGGYVESKYFAELKVKEYITKGLPIVIVNPAYVMGPNDIKPTPSGRILLDFMNRKLPAYMDMYFSVCHVEDVAKGHLLALKHGVIGERYILAGENLSLESFLRLAEEETHIKRPKIKMPSSLLTMAAVCFEIGGKILGKDPLVTQGSVSISKKPMCMKSDKAMQNLGYRFRSTRETIRDSARWFVENGFVN